MRSNFLFFKNIPSKNFFIKNAIEIDYLTRIRIWKSGDFIETADSQKQYMYTTAKSFLSSMTKGCQVKIGHVSVETKEIYASLRSNQLSKPKQRFTLTRHPGIDERIEKRPPDYLLDLYTLETDNIKIKFEEHLKSDFATIGNNCIFKYFEKDISTELAYDLLLAGGIKELTFEDNFVKDYIKDYIITNPNNLAQLVFKAHSNEQTMLRSAQGILRSAKPSNKI